MSSELVTVTAQIPASDVELLDRFAAAARFPRRSRAAALRYLVETSRPMLEHVVDLVEAADAAPDRIKVSVDRFVDRLELQMTQASEALEELRRTEPPSLRAVGPPPSNRGVTP